MGGVGGGTVIDEESIATIVPPSALTWPALQKQHIHDSESSQMERENNLIRLTPLPIALSNLPLVKQG